MDYSEMLKKVRERLPESVFERNRFEIPQVQGHIQGNKTIINNFVAIADILGRQPEHVLKFILKELATPGELKKNGSVIMGTKVTSLRVNEKVRQYAQEFVLCSECGKPDTKLEKDGLFTYLKCAACGARHTVKSKI